MSEKRTTKKRKRELLAIESRLIDLAQGAAGYPTFNDGQHDHSAGLAFEMGIEEWLRYVMAVKATFQEGGFSEAAATSSECPRRITVSYNPDTGPARVFTDYDWQPLTGVPTRAYCPDHAREPAGRLEQEVLEILTPVDMQTPDDITNAIARLARELDERAGPTREKMAALWEPGAGDLLDAEVIAYVKAHPGCSLRAIKDYIDVRDGIAFNEHDVDESVHELLDDDRLVPGNDEDTLEVPADKPRTRDSEALAEEVRAGPILGKPTETELEVSEDPETLRAELDITDGLLNDRDGFILALAGILGECPAHGPTCMPHLLQAVRELAGRKGRISCASVESLPGALTADARPGFDALTKDPRSDVQGAPACGFSCGKCGEEWSCSTVHRCKQCSEQIWDPGAGGEDRFWDVCKDCCPGHAAKSWRPLVEGDVIREGDRLREDGGSIFCLVELTDRGWWRALADGEKTSPRMITASMGELLTEGPWEILR